MTSNQRDPSKPATDADAAKALDGSAQADYASSDMAHAAEEAQHEHHREHTTDTEAARRVDGPAAADYASSDMARAAEKPRREG